MSLVGQITQSGIDASLVEKFIRYSVEETQQMIFIKESVMTEAARLEMKLMVTHAELLLHLLEREDLLLD